ncbi:uncharacterized protein DUF4262 [Microbacterium sp. SLBN-154]|uniref:DUF4262 domain-containing protein n=1 Tax=Microbacterium sp. SLBN-154 TaxID=2768458 RepID=UPI00115304B5|nr:DUF4262 domain-containing protein [Microbacterium sp. SLBN-154]TQK17859.1 uncharacterized protein DUF4262 [Microbacterium sp. SLBN-154]
MFEETPLAISAWLDQEDAHVADMIRRHGVHITYVGGACGAPGCSCEGSGEGPSFAYTTGLFGIGHPELAIVNVKPGTAQAVLNDVAGRVRTGEGLIPGMLLTFGDRWAHRVIVETIPNPAEIAFTANRHYQRPDVASVPLFQLTYDDLGGRFPWEDGYRNTAEMQPRPGKWSA